MVEIYPHICSPREVMMMLMLLSRSNIMVKSFVRRDDKNTGNLLISCSLPLAIVGIDSRGIVVVVAVAVLTGFGNGTRG